MVPLAARASGSPVGRAGEEAVYLMLQRALRLQLPWRLRKWREQPQFDLSLMLDLI